MVEAKTFPAITQALSAEPFISAASAFISGFRDALGHLKPQAKPHNPLAHWLNEETIKRRDAINDRVSAYREQMQSITIPQIEPVYAFDSRFEAFQDYKGMLGSPRFEEMFTGIAGIAALTVHEKRFFQGQRKDGRTLYEEASELVGNFIDRKNENRIKLGDCYLEPDELWTIQEMHWNRAAQTKEQPSDELRRTELERFNTYRPDTQKGNRHLEDQLQSFMTFLQTSQTITLTQAVFGIKEYKDLM